MPAIKTTPPNRHEHRVQLVLPLPHDLIANRACPAITSGSSNGWMNVHARFGGERVAVRLRVVVAVAGAAPTSAPMPRTASPLIPASSAA